MNIQLLAADIARRVPEMAKDSPVNNAEMLAGLIREEIERHIRTLACFNCRDGYTPLYCLNCASEIFKNT